MSHQENQISDQIDGGLLKQKQQFVEQFVEKWMQGHEEDTFVKNKYGNYIYSAGASSLNLKIFFEMLLLDFAEETDL
jgi:hypothetical protein